MLEQRHERQRYVDTGGTVQQHGPGQAMPNGDGNAQATFRYRDRNQSECVIGEMGCDVSEQYQARTQAQVLPSQAELGALH
jgi:hypothetical protein